MIDTAEEFLQVDIHYDRRASGLVDARLSVQATGVEHSHGVVRSGGIVLDDVAAAIFAWVVLSIGIALWNRYRKTKKADHF